MKFEQKDLIFDSAEKFVKIESNQVLDKIVWVVSEETYLSCEIVKVRMCSYTYSGRAQKRGEEKRGEKKRRG